MKILLIGATGRVGQSVLMKTLAKGHTVTAFVNDPKKIKLQRDDIIVIRGNIEDAKAFETLKTVYFDAIINVAGADPLKPSTLFTDATQLCIRLLEVRPAARYFAITGIAQMPKTFFGAIAIARRKLTSVKNAIKDHTNAYKLIFATTYKWTLVACPYIRGGEERGGFTTYKVFSGGGKIIHPADLAEAVVNELDKENVQKVVGAWYS